MIQFDGSIVLKKDRYERDDPAITLAGGGRIDDSSITAAYAGRIYKINESIEKPFEQIDINTLMEFYIKHQSNLSPYIDGHYIILIFDRKVNRMYIFQGGRFAPLNVYYCFHNDVFYFSTSLKRLLKNSGIRRELNIPMLDTFFYNGIIANENTLLKNVYKLTTDHYIGLDLGSGRLQLETANRASYQMNQETAMKYYYPALEFAVKNDLRDKSHANLCLSAGFDSNLLLHITREANDNRINTFSLGGAQGLDESVRAQEICNLYQDVHLTRGIVDPDTLNNFPDIVWRLEGSVCELGIFLQYELAKTIRESNERFVICGEGSDQVHNVNFYPPYPKELPVVLSWKEQPYEIATYLVIKKNGIMLNAFSIESYYPYTYQIIIEMGRALKEYNSTSKEFQKEIAREKMRGDIYPLLIKIGGATYLEALYGDKASYINLMRKVYRLPLNDEYGSKDRIKPATILYVSLFNELFISGKYDEYLDETAFPLKFYDVL